MSELISGKEALIALANGEEVEYFDTRETFKSIGWTDAKGMQAWLFIQSTDGLYKFRIKPRTINEVDVPTPFEPKHGEILWHTEDEIKQVVSTLRSIFKGEVK